MSKHKNLALVLGMGAGVAGIALLASRKAKASAPTAPVDEQPALPPPVEQEGEPFVAPVDEPPPPLPPELEDIIEELPAARPQPQPQPQPAPRPSPQPAPAPAPDSGTVPVFDEDDDEDDDEEPFDEPEEDDDPTALTPAEVQYVRALNASVDRALRSAQGSPAMAELAALIRHAVSQADPLESLERFRALYASGLPPTLATYCRGMVGDVEGLEPHMDLDEVEPDYPQAVALLRSICELSPPAEVPSPRAEPVAAPAPQPVAAPAPQPVAAPRPAPAPPRVVEPELDDDDDDDAPEDEPQGEIEMGPARILPPDDYDPVKARNMATQVARNIDSRGCANYSRPLLRDFQRHAGLVVDGIYGGGSRGALVHFGVARPPQPCTRDKTTRPYRWADAE